MTQQEALVNYCLRLGDSSLILGHRLSEWCGHGPMLEEDIALTNIALDLVGQARTMLQYAGEVEGKNRNEDDLAFLRDALQYRNLLITEQPNGDYAFTIVRQFLYSAFTYYLYTALKTSNDATVAAFAEKSLKEVTYHLRHASEWTIRMGDGTPESHQRAQDALDELWRFTGELFEMNQTDEMLLKQQIAVDLTSVKKQWLAHVTTVLEKATLTIPEKTFMMTGSQTGQHSEHLGYLLAEMQYLQRAYPNAQW